MLRSLKSLESLRVDTTEGELGHVSDFYVDDERWVVRYLVVDTGGLLSGRRVLISPRAIVEASWPERVIALSLTRRQVEDSPSADLDRPVSRRYEEQLHAHYGWALYWGAGAGVAGYPMPFPPPREVGSGPAEGAREDPEASRIRSARELRGYHIEAIDGSIGHVEDFVVEDASWSVRYLVVDTRNWWPGKKVLIPPDWAERISWPDREVHVVVSRETVRGSPEFDPAMPVNRRYEARLYDYYGRPVYWEGERASGIPPP